MDPGPFVSVIVPAFNAECYINRCIDSVLSQTLQNIQLIVVDDGSTDETAACALRYADPRVKVIRKSNGGVSSAKNAGLKHAVGEYVLFLDSDDWIEESYLLEAYQAATAGDLDIIASALYMNRPGGVWINDLSSPPSAEWGSKESILSDLLSIRNASFGGTRIYKRSLLEKHKISFVEGIHISEDRILDIMAFYYAKRVGKIDKAFLHYFWRSDSLSHRRNIDHMGNIAAHRKISDFILRVNLKRRFALELNYLEYRFVFLSLVKADPTEKWHYSEYLEIRNNIRGYSQNDLVRRYRKLLPKKLRLLSFMYTLNYQLGTRCRIVANVLRGIDERH